MLSGIFLFIGVNILEGLCSEKTKYIKITTGHTVKANYFHSQYRWRSIAKLNSFLKGLLKIIFTCTDSTYEKLLWKYNQKTKVLFFFQEAGWLTGIKECDWLQYKDVSTYKGLFPENFTCRFE